MNSKKQVERFEKILGITFPASYREFLIERGTAKIAGYTILGILKEANAPAKAVSEDANILTETVIRSLLISMLKQGIRTTRQTGPATRI